MKKISKKAPVGNLFPILFALVFVLPASISAETILLKNGDKVYATVIDQSTDSVTILKETKRQSIPKNQILKIIFKEIKDETELAKIIEAEKKKLNKEGKKTDKEEQLDTIMLEQMIKENSYKVVQKRLALIEKYIEEQDASWEEYITTKRSPWDPVWRSAVLPGWGLSHMKQNAYGKTYQMLFIFSALAYFGFEKAAQDRSSKHDNKVNDILLKDPLIYAQINAALPAATAQLFIQQDQISKLQDLNKIKSQEHNYSSYSHNALGIGIGIYAIQLLHSYFTGKTWATHNQVETPSGEKVSAGINVKSVYIPMAAGGSLAGSEYRTDVRYVTLF
ncbi:hypothetical protein LEP1GSC058_1711 [Leptospira fainei serovar Hurstbridge str. BUT 6]|uniref:DUF5683 domain-containing protein n=1 Tax=Leptospira fainei serovar Hurstbridge str. BUT 6 TaxID=1193011 RepID=S3UZS8_9LEPT|nr:hypothetical protein [Leptospira fainei]EPG74728.1 hypothetical protein LEP1GSC058_1711 [Leptospira fainei serovar Hurstbridge str. BUT 6]